MSAIGRERMESDVRLIQEALPGMVAADSLAYVHPGPGRRSPGGPTPGREADRVLADQVPE